MNNAGVFGGTHQSEQRYAMLRERERARAREDGKKRDRSSHYYFAGVRYLSLFSFSVFFTKKDGKEKKKSPNACVWFSLSMRFATLETRIHSRAH